MIRSRVPLPPGAEPPYRVFVNGVPQTAGQDYEVSGHALVFARELRKEGRLGFWRWTLMFLSIMGTYRKNDSVDVEYSHAGTRQIAVGLDIEEQEGATTSGS
ncbi:MAG TPA: hypothetical protein VF715_13800 [Thermoleophilaceae bacterium]